MCRTAYVASLRNSPGVRALRESPPRTASRLPRPRRAGGTAHRAVWLNASQDSSGSGHGDRRRHAIPTAAPTRISGAAHQPVARRRQTQQTFLPPLFLRQGHLEAASRRVAPHRRVIEGNSFVTRHSMDLLERYIHAVRFWLPRDQQDDVAAELAEDIRSQIEEQESRLGRALNESEVAALLKQRGRPLLVANRYRPQHYLIGPALFPVYRFVLIIVTLCYLVPWTLTWIGLAAFDPTYHANVGRTLGPLWGTFWLTTFVALGSVTLIFAILERVQPSLTFLTDWNPRDLPAVSDPSRISRINSTIDLAVNLAFAVWWVTDMWSTTINHAGVRIILAPVWRQFLWAFLLIALANIILAVA